MHKGPLRLTSRPRRPQANAEHHHGFQRIRQNYDAFCGPLATPSEKASHRTPELLDEAIMRTPQRFEAADQCGRSLRASMTIHTANSIGGFPGTALFHRVPFAYDREFPRVPGTTIGASNLQGPYCRINTINPPPALSLDAGLTISARARPPSFGLNCPDHRIIPAFVSVPTRKSLEPRTLFRRNPSGGCGRSPWPARIRPRRRMPVDGGGFRSGIPASASGCVRLKPNPRPRAQTESVRARAEGVADFLLRHVS